AVERENERMADFFHAVQRAQFLLGTGRVGIEGVEVSEDELAGLEDAAGSFAFPRLAEAAAAELLDEAVAGDRLGVGRPKERHKVTRSSDDRRDRAVPAKGRMVYRSTRTFQQNGWPARNGSNCPRRGHPL